jgi:hypothetical protein
MKMMKVFTGVEAKTKKGWDRFIENYYGIE